MTTKEHVCYCANKKTLRKFTETRLYDIKSLRHE